MQLTTRVIPIVAAKFVRNRCASRCRSEIEKTTRYHSAIRLCVTDRDKTIEKVRSRSRQIAGPRVMLVVRNELNMVGRTFGPIRPSIKSAQIAD
jgi:hypothetical protein